MARPVVLVHGAWHGGWCWERVTPHLDRAGVPWSAPDLPSRGPEASDANLGIDVSAVEVLLDGLPGDEPAVLCGHSRGGLVLTEVGNHPRVGHLVYLAALLLEEGESAADVVGDTALFDNIVMADDRTALPNLGPGADIFYNDCSGEDIAWATSQLQPQNMFGGGPRPSRQAWRSTPSTYVVCGRDRALAPDSQRRLAARAAATVEWDTGHSPFINRPELVAALLIGLSLR